MRIITFGTAKRAFLTFEAEEVEFQPDGEAFIITASGQITFQDAPAAEEMLAQGRYPCLVNVQEGSETLLNEHYRVTFLILEPDQLVARLEMPSPPRPSPG